MSNYFYEPATDRVVLRVNAPDDDRGYRVL